MNKLVIASAGSGKTTLIIEQAKRIKDQNVLITTYTEENQVEIQKRFGGYIPSNITIQTWFSFLLQHGVRPYQSVMHNILQEKKIGFYLTEQPSGIRYYDRNNGRPVYWGETDTIKYYFSPDFKIYSDKIGKFVFECNSRTNGEVINRIAKIYPHIYIDEVQDLAGWELELLKLLFDSASNIFLVGDPRQTTFSTHFSRKHSKYADGKIKEFIQSECSKKRENNTIEIDETTLNRSHRNNELICNFSSSLYPEYLASQPCECCRNYTENHEGIFWVKEEDVETYLHEYKPVQLRWSSQTQVNSRVKSYNFGQSKGMAFDRVLIYPTDDMLKWIFDNTHTLQPTARAKFYVAITRARYSVGIVYKDSKKFHKRLLQSPTLPLTWMPNKTTP